MNMKDKFFINLNINFFFNFYLNLQKKIKKYYFPNSVYIPFTILFRIRSEIINAACIIH